MTRSACIVLCLLLLTAGSCATAPKYSQAQLNALETRDVDADLDETFRAASSALFDAGYTLSMSDRRGGVLTGTRAVDRSAARFWWGRHVKDKHFTISVMIREEDPARCAVRIKTAINGQQKVDEAAIDQFWNLMQRQVLMHAPLAEATGP